MALLLLSLTSCAGEPPDTLGTQAGRLSPCPDSPNCLSSDERREGHRIEPFAVRVPPREAWAALRRVVETYPKASIVTDTGSYMHAEFKVSVFGFVDDVEFHLRPEDGIIAVRSASRLGYSDLGVNGRRVERVRRLLKERGVI
jgi:uncharacterized protein (DUF1499 family)